MPTSLVAVICVLIVVAIVGAILKQKLGGLTDSAGQGNEDNYALRSSILTPAERSFIGVLEPQLPDGVGYLAKIRLGDVFVTKKGLDASRRTRARNRINQKHVDFLLVRTRDLKPLAGIELDDSSHDAEDRQKRDAFVDEVFKSCQLPLLHVRASATYNPAELRASIVALLPDKSNEDTS